MDDLCMTFHVHIKVHWTGHNDCKMAVHFAVCNWQCGPICSKTGAVNRWLMQVEYDICSHVMYVGKHLHVI